MYNYLSVVLIQPHCSFALNKPNVLSTEYDAVGLLAISAFLKAKGFKTKIVHFARALARGYTKELIFNMIDNLDPFLFGISMNWMHLSQGAIEIAAWLRNRYPGMKIYTGGAHATLFAGEIMHRYADCFDGVIMGEGEETFAEIAERIYNCRPLDGIQGLLTGVPGNTLYQPRLVTSDINHLPLYSYKDVFPAPREGDPAAHFAALNTTRGGCTRDCTYCLESGSLGKLGRQKTVVYETERLIDQILQLKKEGKDFITIEDQFTCHGENVLGAFAEALSRKQVKLKHLSLFVEPGTLSPAIYDLLEQTPIDEIVVSYGIETGSARVALNMNRRIDYGKIYNELEYAGKKNFYAASWWMVGLPEETAVEIAETKTMILETFKMGIFPQSVSPLILFPQTELAKEHTRFKMRLLFNTFEDFKKYSFAEKKELGIYPELITHDSVYQPLEDTLQYLKEIKHTIMEKADLQEYLEGKKRTLQTEYINFRKNEIF